LQESQGNKKTNIKSTPPRPIEHPTPKQDLLNTPLPDSPISFTVDNSVAELNLIAAINKLNSSKTTTALLENGFPPLLKMKHQEEDVSTSSKDKVVENEIEQTSVSYDRMEIPTNDTISFFMKSFPEHYPPDWSLSPANNYQQPPRENLDAVDSSLIPENE
jgi:hypothetical protein